MKSAPFTFALLLASTFAHAELRNSDTVLNPTVDLTDATILVTIDTPTIPEQSAVDMLIEEIQSRTGIALPRAESATGPRIKITRLPAGQTEIDPEGFTLTTETENDTPVVTIAGADPRGVLFGVGTFLRKLEWGRGELQFPAGLTLATSPKYPIRGHQLGYRNRANSWDAWTVEQFDQYIRELAIFGANAIENIPFEDTSKSPHMKLPRNEMNIRMSEICAKYGMDYWLWTPAEFDLSDSAQRAALLAKHEQLYRECPQLDGVFFPGGDPGNNPPQLVMPYLKDVAAILKQHHPDAGVWMSMQGFNGEDQDYVHDYLAREKPAWFTGIVAGPSSPPLAETRERLPKQYKLRDYPDITHTIRCQHETPQWDQAFALTLGRECVNPEPQRYREVHNAGAPHTDGFIAYSDGVHDDVNKAVWSRAAWDPEESVQTMLQDYTRFFLGPEVQHDAAQAILDLEHNWRGPLGDNKNVEQRHAIMTRVLVPRAGKARDTWRWQSLELRSVYDLYIQKRQRYEQNQERAANEVLRLAEDIGADQAMDIATKILERADTENVDQFLRTRIEQLCDSLYESIGLQTSVEKHSASGAERGAVLDFVDYPLNNRWWLADEFKKVRAMNSETDKTTRLLEIAQWENPAGCVAYDDIGNVARSPNLVHPEPVNLRDGTWVTPPEPEPSFAWWDNGMSRQRLSWQSYMDWPLGLAYLVPDTEASYTIRMTGYGEALTRINGERVEPTRYGKDYGEIKEFPVPREAVQSGRLSITWDKPDERHLNWRQHSRVTEVWLIRE